MPGFDRTGPKGMGAMTGGARGFCTPRGRALNRGRPNMSSGFAGGRRHGSRNMFRATGLPGWRRTGSGRPGFDPPASNLAEDGEMATLKNQAASLKDELAKVESRLRDLESQ